MKGGREPPAPRGPGWSGPSWAQALPGGPLPWDLDGGWESFQECFSKQIKTFLWWAKRCCRGRLLETLDSSFLFRPKEHLLVKSGFEREGEPASEELPGLPSLPCKVSIKPRPSHGTAIHARMCAHHLPGAGRFKVQDASWKEMDKTLPSWTLLTFQWGETDNKHGNRSNTQRVRVFQGKKSM